MAETETNVITQPEGEQFAIRHDGHIALHGDKEQAPLLHQFGGQVMHSGSAQQPLVHMICWDSDDWCGVRVDGGLTISGNPDQPIQVKMQHEFANPHQQNHHVEPVDHTLHVDSQLARPIHHALQMRTPLQLRFCNPWHIVSDYVLDINLGNNRVISVRLTGATVATPQPCVDEDCPPPNAMPDHP
ncbi:MAG: hypothetical protein SH847_12965 [Roseiflexaceae bacterium]|nr:hypothetical protein [Roseiflexaceae bacterium]